MTRTMRIIVYSKNGMPYIMIHSEPAILTDMKLSLNIKLSDSSYAKFCGFTLNGFRKYREICVGDSFIEKAMS